MRFLVVGLGSMGKRRVRDLKKLGHETLGYDIDLQKTDVLKLSDDVFNDVDRMIICTPPDQHIQYIEMAIKYRISAFIEQSAILQNLEELNETAKKYEVALDLLLLDMGNAACRTGGRCRMLLHKCRLSLRWIKTRQC